jgi:LysR family glycine cleavage system transcriptional activator
MTPILAPALALQGSRPADLLRLPLIRQEDIGFVDPPADWAAWFTAAGMPTPYAVGGPRFSPADHALDAAEAGTGVVLGRLSFAERALEDGGLIAPFDLALSVPARFRALCLPETRDRPAVAAFLAWVVTEARGAAEAPRRFRVPAGSRG